MERTDRNPKRSTRNSSRVKTREEVLAKIFAEVDVDALATDTTYNFTCVNTVEKLLQVFEDFLADDPAVIAIDTETEGLKWAHRIIGVSFFNTCRCCMLS